ncbi:MAG: hypothetical protein WCX28_03395 [Bacteriovoracaceae bacterium]|nr:hypothetical protein [Bacteroidota bacterium]
MNSLGRAVVAMKGDAGLMFYNPASIAYGSPAQIFAGFTNLYPSVLDDNLNVINAGGTYRLEQTGTIGIGVSQFSPNFWTERIILLSFASDQLMENISVGASAKILSWSAESPQGEYAVPEPGFAYTGVSFDLGAFYQIPEIFEQNDLQFGIALLDVTQPSIASNGSSDATLPMKLSTGAAFISRKHHYALYGAATLSEGNRKLAFGYELSAFHVSAMGIESELFIRFGAGRVTKTDSQGEYNGGFGIVVNKVKIDYSYSYQAFLQNVGGISSIAMSYEF